MSFSLARYHQALSTEWLGRHADHYAELDSTSSHLKRRARDSSDRLAKGLVVVADLQTAGYGQQRREWVSGADRGLYCSIWLPIALSARPFTLLAGVAAAAALREATGSEEVGLKWVNDLVCHGRKLGGILAEVVGTPAVPGSHGLILGVGINLASQGLPEAIALADLGDPPSRETLLAALMNHLEHWIAAGDARLLEQWGAYSVTIGAHVRAQLYSEAVEGVAEGITPSGALLIRQADGSIREIASGMLRRADGRYC